MLKISEELFSKLKKLAIDELDWGRQEGPEEAGYCYLCGLEKYQICFHERTDYVRTVQRLVSENPRAAYDYAQNTYVEVLETLRNLPEKHELAKKPPHTFFSKKYFDWLESLSSAKRTR